jgi:TonB family protein
MTAMRAPARIAIAAMISLGCGAAALASDDELSRAKELYLSAAYEDALTVLDGLKGDTATDLTEAAEYRVFCLLALQRSTEAEKAIETIVTLKPFYQPSEAQASPRIRSVFHDVRLRVLPTIVQRAYADAKTAFEGKDPRAAVMFERVLQLLDDPDVKALPGLADLRTVATGFRDLSKEMGSPAGPDPAARVADTAKAKAGPAGTTAASPERPAAPASAASRLSAASPAPAPVRASTPTKAAIESPVVPPEPLSQQLPRWTPSRPSEQRQEFKGTLDVTIDEDGRVAAATISKSINPTYDAELLRAARLWRFKPATQDGKPVRYMKVIEIVLRPTN